MENVRQSQLKFLNIISFSFRVKFLVCLANSHHSIEQHPLYYHKLYSVRWVISKQKIWSAFLSSEFDWLPLPCRNDTSGTNPPKTQPKETNSGSVAQCRNYEKNHKSKLASIVFHSVAYISQTKCALKNWSCYYRVLFLKLQTRG